MQPDAHPCQAVTFDVAEILSPEFTSLSPGAVKLLLVARSFGDRWPGMAALATCCGRDVRQIKRYIAELRRAGFLDVGTRMIHSRPGAEAAPRPEPPPTVPLPAPAPVVPRTEGPLPKDHRDAIRAALEQSGMAGNSPLSLLADFPHRLSVIWALRWKWHCTERPPDNSATLARHWLKKPLGDPDWSPSTLACAARELRDLIAAGSLASDEVFEAEIRDAIPPERPAAAARSVPAAREPEPVPPAPPPLSMDQRRARLLALDGGPDVIQWADAQPPPVEPCRTCGGGNWALFGSIAQIDAGMKRPAHWKCIPCAQVAGDQRLLSDLIRVARATPPPVAAPAAEALPLSGGITGAMTGAGFETEPVQAAAAAG